jgi:hypothetical protein
MSTIVALDLSKRSTGWALWEQGSDSARFGTWTLGSEYTSRGGTYRKLRQHVADLSRLVDIQHIFFEEPLRPEQLQGHTNIESLRVLTGLAATAECLGEELGCRTVMPVHNKTWRAQFIGRQKRGTGRETLKDLAKERCRQLGMKPRNDDEADAIGLLDYGCEALGIVPVWRRGEVLRPPLGVA